MADLKNMIFHICNIGPDHLHANVDHAVTWFHMLAQKQGGHTENPPVKSLCAVVLLHMFFIFAMTNILVESIIRM